MAITNTTTGQVRRIFPSLPTMKASFIAGATAVMLGLTPTARAQEVDAVPNAPSAPTAPSVLDTPSGTPGGAGEEGQAGGVGTGNGIVSGDTEDKTAPPTVILRQGVTGGPAEYDISIPKLTNGIREILEGEQCWDVTKKPIAGNEEQEALHKLYKRFSENPRVIESIKRLDISDAGRLLDILCLVATPQFPMVQAMTAYFDDPTPTTQHRLYFNRLQSMQFGEVSVPIGIAPLEGLNEGRSSKTLLADMLTTSLSQYSSGVLDGSFVPYDAHRLDASYMHVNLFAYNWFDVRLLLLEMAKEEEDDVLYEEVVRPFFGAFVDIADKYYYLKPKEEAFTADEILSYRVEAMIAAMESGLPLQQGIIKMMTAWNIGVQQGRIDPAKDGCVIQSKDDLAASLREHIDPEMPWEYFLDIISVEEDYEGFMKVVEEGMAKDMAPRCSVEKPVTPKR